MDPQSETILTHPKIELYQKVYDPLVSRWFELFVSNVNAAKGIKEFDDLLMTLSDVASAEMSTEMMEVVTRNLDFVQWDYNFVPNESSLPHEIRLAFRYKFRRNIGLAFLEALTCLSSAHAFVSDFQQNRDIDIRSVLENSSQLIATMASLHDSRAVVFMDLLLPKHVISYPQASFEDVCSGKIQIAKHHFHLVESESIEVRFATKPPRNNSLSTPTVMCPGHRMKDVNHQRYNKSFWLALVDAYFKDVPVDFYANSKPSVTPPLSRAQLMPSRKPSDDEQLTAHQLHSRMLADLLTRPVTKNENPLYPSEDLAFRKSNAESMLKAVNSFQRRLTEHWKLSHGPDGEELRLHIRNLIMKSDYDKLAELGLDVNYLWLDDVVNALVGGYPFVEIETMNPNAAHHIEAGDRFSMDFERLAAHEQVGVLLGALARSLRVNGETPLRLIASLDDRQCTPTQSDQFVLATSSLMIDNQLVRQEDNSGNEHLIYRLSDYRLAAEKLIEMLSQVDAGKVVTQDGDYIFRPTQQFVDQLAIDCEANDRDLREFGVRLTRGGEPEIHVLHAATYLPQVNFDILHVIFRDRHFSAEQDRIYALLRAVDVVRQEQHHTVLFNVDLLEPIVIVQTVCDMVEQELRRLLNEDKWTDLTQFDPVEHSTRNYNTVVSEDRKLIQFALQKLTDMGIELESCRLVADVGAGPNFYPAMLLAPYVAAGGAIDLIESSANNRYYIERVLSEARYTQRTPHNWALWEETLIASAGHHYQDAFQKVSRVANPVSGSAFSLPRNRYELITSVFSPESITTSRRMFWRAVQAQAQALQQGGTLIAIHTLQSTHYGAGVNSKFPPVNIDARHVEQAYRDAGLKFETFVLGALDDRGGNVASDTTYGGKMVVVATREDRS